MFRRLHKGALAVVACICAEAAANSFQINWSTVDGGVQNAASSAFRMRATAGQPDAGPQGGMNGPGFALSGGYWAVASLATCAADLDGDGQIGVADLSILLENFGLPGGLAQGDLDGDGDITIADLSELLTNFGAACP